MALFPRPDARDAAYPPRACTYGALFEPAGDGAVPLSAPAIGDLLRHALGLSAWKRFRESRWSLRVNPSSGNLHPTEAYVVAGATSGLAATPGVFHYAPDRHLLERRCAFDADAWRASCEGRSDVLLVVLASIHWREAWKYGERAFRYCQHDLGHAIAAIALAARMLGWRSVLVPAWSHAAIAALVGADRDRDFVDAEREEPACLLALTPGTVPEPIWSATDDLVDAVRRGQWTGRASQLSADHVEWSFVTEVAAATVDRGRRLAQSASPAMGAPRGERRPDVDARRLLLQRRSALAFDGRTTIERETFLAMLARLMPAAGGVWDALWWEPCVHLALFVHRVNGVAPGLYLLIRRREARDELRAALGPELLWEDEGGGLPLVCLGRGDSRRLAARLCCDQEIAGDGCFSFGMLARFAPNLERWGPGFYRHLFWETGVVGQIAYLEAEAAGVRATGIGCFYDDPVHETLGLEGHQFQSLYHFTVGGPVEDARLTSEPGYDW